MKMVFLLELNLDESKPLIEKMHRSWSADQSLVELTKSDYIYHISVIPLLETKHMEILKIVSMS